MDTQTQKPIPVHVNLWNFFAWIMHFAIVVLTISYDTAKSRDAWKATMATVLIFNAISGALVWITHVPEVFDRTRPHHMRRLLRYGIYPAVTISVMGTLVLILDSNMTDQGFKDTWFGIGKWFMSYILIAITINSIKLLKMYKVTRANNYGGRIGSVFTIVLLCLPVSLVIAIQETCLDCNGNWLSLNDFPSVLIVISILATFTLILVSGFSGIYGMKQREKDLKEETAK